LKMKSSFSFAIVFVFLPATIGAPGRKNCDVCLTNLGVSKSFDAMVAHGVHSMTVDDLKKFDSLATENNFVPTIDFDLHSEHAILPYAPDLKNDENETSLTEGMKVLDLVLSHMNEKHWDISAFNPLERIVHAFHMREVWARVKIEFDKINKTVQAPDSEACQCIMDLENNGIMKVMRFMAMGIREPGLVYGDPTFSDRNYLTKQVAQYYIPYPYNYHFLRSEAMQKTQNVPMEKMLIQNMADAMPPLKDAESWKIWKGQPHPTMEHQRDLAYFLYCAIQKAHQQN